MSDDKRVFLDDHFEEMRIAQEESMRRDAEESDAWWNSLTTEEQHLAFYTVIRKVYQYRVIEGRGYRGTLYDGFGWGGETYGMGMACNFFDLHNMIHNALLVEEIKSENFKMSEVLKQIRVGLERPTSSNGRNQWKDAIDEVLGDYDDGI